MNRTPLTPHQLERLDAWEAGLDHYRQTTKVLQAFDGSACCLGVLCHVSKLGVPHGVGDDHQRRYDDGGVRFSFPCCGLPFNSFENLPAGVLVEYLSCPFNTAVAVRDRCVTLNDSHCDGRYTAVRAYFAHLRLHGLPEPTETFTYEPAQ